MKRAFTLVEMLVVVVVLVTLMTIVFRLTSLGQSQSARSITVNRMQRLENCLSGYYAAFGSYPPVKVQGTRNIYAQVGDNGLQDRDGNENENIWGWTAIGQDAEYKAWRQVCAACRSQPLACKFPFTEDRYDEVKQASAEVARRASSNTEQYKAYWSSEYRRRCLSAGFNSLLDGNVGGVEQSSDWLQAQVFQFGVLSYLLPRYIVMLNYGNVSQNGSDASNLINHPQWTDNNTLPCDPYTGDRFNDWTTVRGHLMKYMDSNSQKSDLAHLANIPTQAACARWVANLAGICACSSGLEVFGVSLKGSIWCDSDDIESLSAYVDLFTPDGEGTANQYALNHVTVRDGWGHEFYYYSPSPYQSYVLWSGGANERTFPPWVSREKLTAQANKCVSLWIEDDIIGQKN